MAHRPGHVDGSGDGTQSMDRRKYLSTLAAGAAFGTVAAGLAACAPDKKTETAAPAPAASCATEHQWGYLSIFPPGITTIADARKNMPVDGVTKMIKVPFFNSNGINIKEGDVVGFTLVRIGCPKTRFVVAYNLITDDDEDEMHQDPTVVESRNTEMNKRLDESGYHEEIWLQNEVDGQPCPDPPADWKS